MALQEELDSRNHEKLADRAGLITILQPVYEDAT